MDINLTMLEYFVVTAEEQSISAAANKLFVSQPAVSRQIQNLENKLNVRLFMRSKPRLVLTEEGKSILCQAKSILNDVNILAARGSSVPITTTLRIGYSGNLEMHALFHIVSIMAQKHPRCKMEFINANMSHLHNELYKGNVDIILSPLTGLAESETLSVFPIIAAPMVLAVSVHNPLAKRKNVSLKDLKNEKFITFVRAESLPHSDLLIMDCNKAGYSPNIIAEASNTNNYMLMIASNMGVALVGENLKELVPCGIEFIPVKEYADRHIYSGAAWLKTNTNPAIAKFKKEMEVMYPRLMDSITGSE